MLYKRNEKLSVFFQLYLHSAVTFKKFSLVLILNPTDMYCNIIRCLYIYFAVYIKYYTSFIFLLVTKNKLKYIKLKLCRATIVDT